MGETKIFGPYWNGAEAVFGDPVRIHRRLYAKLLGRPNDFFAKVRDFEKDPTGSEQAADTVEMAVRYAFDLVPFDPATGGGANQQSAFEVLNQYLEYQDAKKLTGSGSQT